VSSPVVRAARFFVVWSTCVGVPKHSILPP